MADEQLIEQVADQIEEVAQVTRALTGREVGFFVAGAGVGVAIGFSIGFFALNKRVEKKYDDITSAEIDKMRVQYNRHYAEMQKVMAGPKPPLDKVMSDLGYIPGKDVPDEQQARFSAVELEAIAQANANHPGEEEAEDEPQEEEATDTESPRLVPATEVTNVFTAPVEGEQWDYSTETANRSREAPYVIHIDEFRQNEPEHEQQTLTYYEVDDVLADTHDHTVDDIDKVVGLGSLERWGHGSQDANVVYVRNEVLMLDVEIIRDRGSYADMVSGSIRHSHTVDRIRRSRQRFDDDN